MEGTTFAAIVAVVVAITAPLTLAVRAATKNAEDARNKVDIEARRATKRDNKLSNWQGRVDEKIRNLEKK